MTTARIQLFLALVMVVSLASPCPAAAPPLHRGRVVMEFDLSRHPASEAVRLWVPIPQDGPFQRITHLQASGDFARKVMGRVAQGGQGRLLYAEWGPGSRSRRLRISFQVERRARHDLEGPGGGPKARLEDPSPYLLGSRLRPVDGVVKRLALKITQGKEGTLARARAVYHWVCTHMRRNPRTRGCGRGDVCLLLSSPRPGGKCADISSVFVALLRAAGIPAREVLGLRLGRKGRTDITTWQHCWAEFLVEGRGWVAADPGDYLKWRLRAPWWSRLAEAVTHSHERGYFGSLPPWRVRLTTGRDVVLWPRQQGPPLNYFMYPYAEVEGKALDWLDPEGFRYTILHEALPLAGE